MSQNTSDLGALSRTQFSLFYDETISINAIEGINISQDKHLIPYELSLRAASIIQSIPKKRNTLYFVENPNEAISILSVLKSNKKLDNISFSNPSHARIFKKFVKDTFVLTTERKGNEVVSNAKLVNNNLMGKIKKRVGLLVDRCYFAIYHKIYQFGYLFSHLETENKIVENSILTEMIDSRTSKDLTIYMHAKDVDPLIDYSLHSIGFVKDGNIVSSGRKYTLNNSVWAFIKKPVLQLIEKQKRKREELEEDPSAPELDTERPSKRKQREDKLKHPSPKNFIKPPQFMRQIWEYEQVPAGVYKSDASWTHKMYKNKDDMSEKDPNINDFEQFMAKFDAIMNFDMLNENKVPSELKDMPPHVIDSLKSSINAMKTMSLYYQDNINMYMRDTLMMLQEMGMSQGQLEAIRTKLSVCIELVERTKNVAINIDRSAHLVIISALRATMSEIETDVSNFLEEFALSSTEFAMASFEYNMILDEMREEKENEYAGMIKTWIDSSAKNMSEEQMGASRDTYFEDVTDSMIIESKMSGKISNPIAGEIDEEEAFQNQLISFSGSNIDEASNKKPNDSVQRANNIQADIQGYTTDKLITPVLNQSSLIQKIKEIIVAIIKSVKSSEWWSSPKGLAVIALVAATATGVYSCYDNTIWDLFLVTAEKNKELKQIVEELQPPSLQQELSSFGGLIKDYNEKIGDVSTDLIQFGYTEVKKINENIYTPEGTLETFSKLFETSTNAYDNLRAAKLYADKNLFSIATQFNSIIKTIADVPPESRSRVQNIYRGLILLSGINSDIDRSKVSVLESGTIGPGLPCASIIDMPDSKVHFDTIVQVTQGLINSFFTTEKDTASDKEAREGLANKLTEYLCQNKENVERSEEFTNLLSEKLFAPNNNIMNSMKSLFIKGKADPVQSSLALADTMLSDLNNWRKWSIKGQSVLNLAATIYIIGDAISNKKSSSFKMRPWYRLFGLPPNSLFTNVSEKEMETYVGNTNVNTHLENNILAMVDVSERKQLAHMALASDYSMRMQHTWSPRMAIYNIVGQQIGNIICSIIPVTLWEDFTSLFQVTLCNIGCGYNFFLNAKGHVTDWLGIDAISMFFTFNVKLYLGVYKFFRKHLPNNLPFLREKARASRDDNTFKSTSKKLVRALVDIIEGVYSIFPDLQDKTGSKGKNLITTVLANLLYSADFFVEIANVCTDLMTLLTSSITCATLLVLLFGAAGHLIQVSYASNDLSSFVTGSIKTSRDIVNVIASTPSVLGTTGFSILAGKWSIKESIFGFLNNFANYADTSRRMYYFATNIFESHGRWVVRISKSVASVIWRLYTQRQGNAISSLYRSLEELKEYKLIQRLIINTKKQIKDGSISLIKIKGIEENIAIDSLNFRTESVLPGDMHSVRGVGVVDDLQVVPSSMDQIDLERTSKTEVGVVWKGLDWFWDRKNGTTQLGELIAIGMTSYASSTLYNYLTVTNDFGFGGFKATSTPYGNKVDEELAQTDPLEIAKAALRNYLFARYDPLNQRLAS